jgi:hypothetical protein
MKKIFLTVFFILCVSCSSENKGDTQLEAHSVNKKNINDPCFNSDCTPEKFNSPYYKIPYEKLKDLEFLNYENFGTVLLSKDVLSSEILKGYSFKDKDNSNYIDLENEAMLTINPNPSTGKVKSIDYEFLTCSSIQLIDKDRIKKIINIFKNTKVNEGFFKFDINNIKEGFSTNTIYNGDKIVYEISCDIKSQNGQFHIYRK